MKIVCLLLCSVLLLSGVMLTTACESTDDTTAPSIEILKLGIGPENTKRFTESSLPSFELYCYNPNRMPDGQLTCYWQIIDDSGGLLVDVGENIYGETVKKLATSPSYYISHINVDRESAKLSREGTYTVKAAVYIASEFKRLGSAAAPLGSATTKLYVQDLKITINAMEGVIGYYFFKVICQNPEYYGNPNLFYKWDFGDKEAIEGYQKDKSEHAFGQNGEYKVTVELSFPTGNFSISRDVVTTAQTIITVVDIPKPEGIPLYIEAPPVLESGISYTFKVKPGVPLTQIPQNTAWKWEFGDDYTPIIKPHRTEADLTMAYTYHRCGDLEIIVTLFRTDVKDFSKSIVGVGSMKVTVNDLPVLKKTNHMKLLITLPYKNDTGSMVTFTGFSQQFSNRPPYDVFEWKDDKTFKFTSRIDINYTLGGPQTITLEAQGRIDYSPQGTIKMNSFFYDLNYTRLNIDGSGKDENYQYHVVLKDIPLKKESGGANPRFRISLAGKEIRQYFVEVSKTGKYAFAPFYPFSLADAVWDNLPSMVIPELEVVLDQIK